ncbi:MAG TPA: hypothetical protein PK367_02810 [Candidatus Paceibacterota bacterium]|nr:hypothetical protein [Candidatus Paceibacterota bacterium]
MKSFEQSPKFTSKQELNYNDYETRKRIIELFNLGISIQKGELIIAPTAEKIAGDFLEIIKRMNDSEIKELTGSLKIDFDKFEFLKEVARNISGESLESEKAA